MLYDHCGLDCNVYYVPLYYVGDAAISQLKEEKEFAEGQVNKKEVLLM